MALSAQTYQGDGTTTDFVLDFTLGYISTAHIHVYVDEVEISQNTLQFVNAGGSVRLPTAPTSGTKVLVRRIVPNDTLIHDYENGALLIEKNLDESNLQAVMLQHQAQDGFATDEGRQGNLNMGTYKLVNMGQGTEPTDGVTLEQAQEIAAQAAGSGVVPQVQPRQQGDGVTTTFTTPANVQQMAQSFFVNLDGISQRPYTDYTVNNDGTLTFDEAPAKGVDIDIVLFEPVSLDNVLKQDEATHLYKATSSQSAVAIMIANAEIGEVCKCENGSEFKRLNSVSGDITDFKTLNCPVASDFGTLGESSDDNLIFSQVVATGSAFKVKKGETLTLDPTSLDMSTCNGIFGGGKLVFTQWAVKTVKDYFFMTDLDIENQAAFGIHLQGGEDCGFHKLRFVNTSTEADEWYHSLRLIDMPRVRVNKLNAVNCGLWLRNCPDVDVSGLFIDVQKAGLGTGEAGTDCLKCTSQTTGNFSHLTLLNASRDGIDMYSSGRDLNLTNFHISNATTHGIEIKVADQTVTEDFPRKINISCFTIQEGVGEKGANNTAGIIIKTDTPESTIKASSITISEGSILRLGDAALSGGNVSGIRAEYTYGLSITGVTIAGIKTSSVVGSDSRGYGLYLLNCQSVTVSACPTIHGDYRGVYASGCTDLSINGGVIGKNVETGDVSDIGLVIPSSSNKTKLSDMSVYGTVRSLSSEGSNVTNLSVSNSTFEGYAYLDTIVNSSFLGSTFISDDMTGDMVLLTNGSCTSVKFVACDFDGGNRSLRLSASVASLIGCSFHNSATTHISANAGKGVITGCDSNPASPLLTATGGADYAESVNYTQ